MSKEIIIPSEIISNKILLLRNKRVMIDRDIAELYGVTTKRLNEQVRRNLNRFPNHFMFELTIKEKNEVVAKCDHLKKLKFSSFLPKVFTEHGVIMLANVLKSEKAIKVSIEIIDVFIKLREMISSHKDLLLKLKEIEEKVSSHDEQMLLIFEYIKQFESTKQQLLKNKERTKIGYKK